MGMREWLDQVAEEISRLSGLHIWDLSDYGYADAYDDGLSPSDAAEEWLINDGSW